MSWGTLTVGRISLKETYEISHQVNATTGVQSVAIQGMEADAWSSIDAVRARQEDLLAMQDQACPIIFSAKDNHTGFYRVKDCGANITEWPEGSWFNWNLSLERIGNENAVDLESRFGMVTRQNAFALTGTRWHAPAVGAYGYYTGTTPPSSSLTRTLAGSEGTIRVYTGIPTDANPVWGSTAPGYLLGRARFKVSDQERSGTGFRIDTTDWELTNGLVRVTPAASGYMLLVESWDGAAWSTAELDVTVTSDLAPPWDAVTVIRNDLECVVIRLIKSGGTVGRTLLDLTIRRGSRLVEGFLQNSTAVTLGVKTNASVTTTNNAASGYIVQTSDDANGNRLTIGVPVSFTGSTTGGVSKTSTVSLPFYVGHVIDGSAPATGDSDTNLRDQYIGSISEQTLAVKR